MVVRSNLNPSTKVRIRAGVFTRSRSSPVAFPAISHTLVSWLVPLLVLLVWESLVQTEVVPARILPAPSQVLSTAVALIVSGELGHHLWVSLKRVIFGFSIGSIIALTLGFQVGLFKWAETLFDRTIQMMRTIPFLALVPLVIMWFGIGESAKVFLVALGVIFPLYINTVLGIRQVDHRLLEVGRVYGLNHWQLVRQVILPGALPSILTGFRYALGTSWLAIVVAETIAASSGIGYMAMNAREFMQADIIVLVIILYALLGALADQMTRTLERRVLAWHPNYTLRPR